MNPDWNENQPIYRQLREKMVAAILDGSLKEGEPLPSVRTVAVDLQINPLTASKAYQELAAENLVEKRRGLGMFIIEGARKKLLTAERDHFLQEEWPRIAQRIQSLGLNIEDLIKAGANGNGGQTS